VPHQRGDSTSSKPRNVTAYGLRTLARGGSRLIETFGEERAHVVGHDWGAAVAWGDGNGSPGARAKARDAQRPAPEVDARGPEKTGAAREELLHVALPNAVAARAVLSADGFAMQHDAAHEVNAALCAFLREETS
jgi:pimeloyl-ACP methyl ester carboxylesterase